MIIKDTQNNEEYTVIRFNKITTPSASVTVKDGENNRDISISNIEVVSK